MARGRSESRRGRRPHASTGSPFRAVAKAALARWRLGVATLVVVISSVIGLSQGPQKHAVYVGAQTCGRCHHGQAQGNQHSLWRNGKHALAYAALAKPEAKRIAELSGIPQEPQEAPICLGCHATAADTEDWEKEDTFRIEDGVQCELCHGAGS